MSSKNTSQVSPTPPHLVWVRLDSNFAEGGNQTNPFYGARISNGWLIWNHDNHTLAFVPDSTEKSKI